MTCYRQFSNRPNILRKRTYDSEAEEKCPETSHRMQLDSLPNSHVVLTIFAIVGAGQGVLVVQDILVQDVVVFDSAFLIVIRTIDSVDFTTSILRIDVTRHGVDDLVFVDGQRGVDQCAQRGKSGEDGWERGLYS